MKKPIWMLPVEKEKKVVEWAVIEWNALNVYVKSKAVKWYVSQKAAQKYADKMNSENAIRNYVVRPSNYMNMSF